MSKGGASAPPAIDPNALAASQAQSNIATAGAQSALNNVNTTSPLGTSFFTQGPDGRWSLNQQLGQPEQGVYNSQLGLGGNLANLGYNIANIVTGPANYGANALGGAFNSIFPSTLNPSPQLQTGLNFGSLGALPSSASGQGLNFEGLGMLPSPVAGSSLNFNSLGALPSSTADFSKQTDAARQAAYNAQAGFLDPQFAQKRSDLRQQLADEGIGVGTDAYSRAQGDLGRQSTLAYQQASDAATQAGQAEQARLFGEDLSARQQGAGELQAAQAANQAQLQRMFGESLASRQQGAGEVQAMQAQQQKLFAEDLAARQQGGSELQAQGTFGNQALQQMWQNPLTALQSLSGIGTGILGLSGFQSAGSLPTFGGSPTTVSPANVVGAGQVAAQNAANRFTAGNTLNNQLFNGVGSLGGALGLGNGGLGSLLGGSGGLFSAGGLLGSQGPLLGTAADASIAAGGAPLALDAAAGAGGWIICTELVRQKKMPMRHYIAGAPVFAAYPEIGKRGYYIWAIPTVRHLRRHPDSWFSKTVGAVFRWRAEDIAARRGIRGARRLWRGRAVTAILYPICKVLGPFVGEQDWKALYDEEIATR
jgi:hypothetical protein